VIPIDAERCQEQMFDAHSYHGFRCSNRSKVVRKGKRYCGRHDPDAVTKRRADRNKERNELHRVHREKRDTIINDLVDRAWNLSIEFTNMEQGKKYYRELLKQVL
jgi:hypothetical protein